MDKITLEDSNLEELLLLCKLNGVTAQTTKRKKLIMALKCHLKRTLANLDDYAIYRYEWPLVSALNFATHMGDSAAKNKLVDHPSAWFKDWMSSEREITQETAKILAAKGYDTQAALRSVTDVELSEMEIRPGQKKVVRQAINRISNHAAQSKGSASAQHNDASENAAEMRIFGTATVELNVARWDHKHDHLLPGVTVEQRLTDNRWVASGLFDDLMKFRQDVAAQLPQQTTIPAPQTTINLARDLSRYTFHIPHVCTVQVYRADLCTEQVDAVVNAANSDLKLGSGIAGALRQRIGPKLQEYCDKTVVQYGVVPVGQARYTPSFDGIPARYVIHAVGPMFLSDCQSNQAKAEALLLATYSSALHEARKLEVCSIAIPGLSTGVFDVPVEISARAAVRAVIAFVNEGRPANLSDIRFVDTSDQVITEFIKRFKACHDRFPTESREISDPSALQKEYSASRVAGCGDSRPNVGSSRFEDSGKSAPDRAWSLEPRSSIVQASSVQNLVPQQSHGPAASHEDGNTDVCAICMEPLQAKSCKVLDKCYHTFHSICLDTAFISKKECPTCRTIYGVITGNQPLNGIMTCKVLPGQMAGFNSPNYIEIEYDFPNGVQTASEGQCTFDPRNLQSDCSHVKCYMTAHPRPGKPYSGTRRMAYLPNTTEGNLVLKLLKVAFDRRLVFTVGDSTTSGTRNTIVWNNIHHKTHLSDSEYGYPDDTYLVRVMEELKAVGVTPESLN